MKIDFKNAFNSIRRDVVLKEIQKQFPTIYPIFWQAYSCPSFLFYGDRFLSFQEGVQQGESLGSFLFSLAIQNLINECKSELNIWYLDDGTLAGNAEDVLSDFNKIINAKETLGLETYSSKCELFFRNSNDQSPHILTKFNSLSSGIKHLEINNLSLLGSPIHQSTIETFLSHKLEDLKRMTERLMEIDPHDAFFLLKHSFSIPKLTYLLRSAPCFNSKVLKKYDSLLKISLEKVINIKLSDRNWTFQSTLPVALGGLRVRSAVNLSLPAFLSSVHACSTHVRKLLPNFHNILDDSYYKSAKILYLEKIGNNSSFLGNPSVQAAWDMQYAKLKHEKLISSSTSDLKKARVLAVFSKQASSWLNAIPKASLGLKINGSQLRTSCALRLGSLLCIAHTCVSGTKVDQSGVHGLSCRKSAGRCSRQAQVNDIIKRALSSAHIPSILEPNGVSRSDGKRPDGMTIYP